MGTMDGPPCLRAAVQISLSDHRSDGHHKHISPRRPRKTSSQRHPSRHPQICSPKTFPKISRRKTTTTTPHSHPSKTSRKETFGEHPQPQRQHRRHPQRQKVQCYHERISIPRLRTFKRCAWNSMLACRPAGGWEELYLQQAAYYSWRATLMTQAASLGINVISVLSGRILSGSCRPSWTR